VDSVAPKSATQDATKTPLKNASGSNDQADDTGADQNDQAANAQSSQPGAVAQPGKPVKTDKNKDDTSAKTDAQTAQAAPDAATVLAQLPQQPGPQNLPVPSTALPAQPAADDDNDDVQVEAATPSAGAQPKPIADPKPAETTPQPESAFAPDLSGLKPAPKVNASSGTPSNGRAGNTAKSQAPANAPAKSSAAAQTAAADSVNDTDDSVDAVQNAEPQAAAPASVDNAPNSAKTAQLVQAWNAGSGRISDTGAAQANAPQTAQAKQDTSNTDQSDAPIGTSAKTDGTDPTAADDAKTGLVKGGTLKTRTLQADNAGKSAGDKSNGSAGDTAKAPALQPDVQTLAAPPKTAPQPAQASFAGIDPAASPQAPSSAAPASTVSQHIQVSAQASPDLPALAVEIAAKSQSGARQFDIRLDPPELGRVEVRLSIDATGKASAHLSADQPHTLSLLQKDAPILTRALRDAGLDVSQNGLNFSLRQQSDNPNGQAGNNGRRPRSFPLSASVSIDATQASTAYRGPADGRLDIRV
jgi:hypothetical protein